MEVIKSMTSNRIEEKNSCDKPYLIYKVRVPSVKFGPCDLFGPLQGWAKMLLTF